MTGDPLERLNRFLQCKTTGIARSRDLTIKLKQGDISDLSELATGQTHVQLIVLASRVVSTLPYIPSGYDFDRAVDALEA